MEPVGSGAAIMKRPGALFVAYEVCPSRRNATHDYLSTARDAPLSERSENPLPFIGISSTFFASPTFYFLTQISAVRHDAIEYHRWTLMSADGDSETAEKRRHQFHGLSPKKKSVRIRAIRVDSLRFGKVWNASEGVSGGQSWAGLAAERR